MAVIHATVFICGPGYVGNRLLKQLYSQKISTISTLSRHETGDKRIEHHQVDLDSISDHLSLDLQGTCVYYLIPPPSAGVTDSRIRSFLSTINPSALPERIVLISTTGVYGHCEGDWVDENRTPSPDTDRGRRRLDAESAIVEWGRLHQVKVIIFRVAGIYGFDKLPVERLKAGKPVLRLDQSPWSNRIHIDDLVKACLRAKDYEGSRVYFNISDGHPSSMSDYFLKVAKVLGLPIPAQISLEECSKIFSKNMLSYLLESKKIDNRRMLAELKIKLDYPDLDAGLDFTSHHPCTEVNQD